MKQKQIFWIVVILFSGAAFAWAILNPKAVPFLDRTPNTQNAETHNEENPVDHTPEMPRGSHGGRVYSQDDLNLEVVLYEQGVPPEFRVYPTRADGQPIPLKEVTLQIDLERIERVDSISFQPAGAYLWGKQVVSEPHSFVIKIKAQWNGKTYRWTRDQIEFRAEISREQAENAGIRVAQAESGGIQDIATLDGEIGLHEERVAHVVPRVESLVVKVYKDMGDSVKEGDLLAVLQSRELADAKNAYLAAAKQAEPARLDHQRQKQIYDNTLIMLDLLKQNLSIDDLYSKINDLYLGHSRAQIVPAYAKRMRTQAVYERERSLYQKKISSRAEYMIALEEFQTAEAQYHALREQVDYQGKLGLLEKKQALEMAELNIKTQAQKLRALGLSSRDIKHMASASKVPFTHYELRSEIGGTVIEKHISPGEAIQKNTSVFVVADLSDVWVNIAIPARDLNRVQLGQQIRIREESLGFEAMGKLFFLGAVLDDKTRTVTGRIIIPNPKRKWRPGMYVKVDLIRNTKNVSVAVPVASVQKFRDWDVVFLRVDNQYEPRPVTLGRSDGQWVEIVGGLRPGDTYVKENSFIIKAELQKSAATHSH